MNLVGWGYVVLLVDSYATRGIALHACTSTAYATFLKRRPDAYGALLYLARQTFVDPRRVAAVGFSSGGWLTLSLWRSPIRSRCLPLQATCSFGRRQRSIRHASRRRRRRDTHDHLHRGA